MAIALKALPKRHRTGGFGGIPLQQMHDHTLSYLVSGYWLHLNARIKKPEELIFPEVSQRNNVPSGINCRVFLSISCNTDKDLLR